MANWFVGRQSKEYRFADAAPDYKYVESPACPLSEYFYMRWLISSYAEETAPDQREGQITFNLGHKSTLATFIQKDYKSSSETKLVLAANDNPILEGMIVHDETNEVVRPICAYARYDLLMPDQHTKLQQELRNLNLSIPPIYDTLTIILSLLDAMSIPVGVHFENNIRDYSEMMKELGNIVKYWGWNEIGS